MMQEVQPIPGEVFVSTYGLTVVKKKHAAKQKQLVEFEKSPPKCGSCVWYMHIHMGTATTPFRPSYCIINKFLLEGKDGLCNQWESKKGETLE